MAIRGAGDTLEAYRTTTVPIHESQSDVRELLRRRGATGMQISEAWSGDDSFADLRFGMAADAGGFFAYRIRVRVPTIDQVLDQSRRAKVKLPTDREARGRGERQIWRLVYWWLKAQFEAADAGLVSLEEAFLPWMELPNGSTAYEAMVATGGLAKVAAGTLPQLTAGR
jgi:hypothetical protein